MILSAKHTGKPILGAGNGIDWSHPLSQGLVGCWLFNEGGGTKAFNLVNNESFALSNLVNTAAGLQKTTTGVLGTATGSTLYSQNGPITLVMGLKISAVSNGACLFGNPNVNGYYGVTMGSASNTINFGKDLVTTDLLVNTPVSFFQLNEKFNFAVTWTGSVLGSGVALYKNGKNVVANISSEGGGVNNVSRVSVIGGYYGGQNATWVNYGTLLYNRILSATEILQLHELTKGW